MVTFVTKVVINVHKSLCKVPVTFIPSLLTLNFLNKNLTGGSRGTPYRQEDRHTHTHRAMTKLMAVLHNFFVNMPIKSIYNLNNPFLLI
jgi:hypothetical protein